MTRREKILAGVTAGLVALGLGYLLVKKAYLDPLAKWEAQRISWANKRAELKRMNAQSQSRARSLRSLAGKTFDSNELEAEAKLAEAILALVERAGLSREKLSVQPVRGSNVRGAYRELGRIIRVRGGLKNIIDFLFLLDAEPHLHRLDQIAVTPVLRSNEVDLQVRYMTPVLEFKNGKKVPTDQIAATAPAGVLDTPRRKLFAPIAARDLFRPYIKRPAAPPTPATPRVSSAKPRTEPPRPNPPAAPASRFRVVGLPHWSDNQEVIVADSSSKQVRSYKPGDTLGGGVIAMVDYRPMPSKANPMIDSPSRVILKIGAEFFAVELGENLADKRRMSSDALPEAIRPIPATAPADEEPVAAAADDGNQAPAVVRVKKTPADAR